MMTTVTKLQYELFQEWLNDCPVKVLDYQDFTDQFQIIGFYLLEYFPILEKFG